MKKHIFILALFGLLACFTGCSDVDSSFQPETTAVTASETVTAARTQTSATTTTTTTAPPPLLPAMSQPVEIIDNLSIPGELSSLQNGIDHTIILTFLNGFKNTCIVFSPVTSEVVRAVEFPDVNTSLVGMLGDGSIAAIKYDGSNTLLIYPADSDEPEKLSLDTDTVYEIKADAENNCIYYIDPDKNGIVRIDRSGKSSILFSDLDCKAMRDMNTANMTFFTRAYTDESITGVQEYLCSLKDGSIISEITDGSWSYFLSGDKSISAYNIYEADATTRKLDIYSASGGEYERSFLLPDTDDVNLFYNGSPNSKYILAAGTGDNVKSIKFIDPATGSFADVDVPSDHTLNWYYSCCPEDFGRWFIALNYSQGATRIIMADPELMTFDKKLEGCQSLREELKPQSCGEKFRKVREEADKVEKEFGIKILVGNEVKNSERGSGYIYISAEEYDDPYIIDNEINDIRKLRSILATYPKGFFEHYKTKSGKGGLRIAIVERLESETYTDFTAAGVSYENGAWFDIGIEDSYILDEGTVHHEIYHSVEELICRKEQFDADEWDKLNPAGFQYTQNYDEYATRYTNDSRTLSSVIYSDNIQYDVPYFVSDYSLITPMEDRAMLIQKLFDMEYDEETTLLHRFGVEGMSQYPHLKAKLDFLADWTKKEFGYVYWEEVLKNTSAA